MFSWQPTPASALATYDFDLPLRDALNDRDLSSDRRVLAGAAIGIGLDMAYLAVSEMEEAFGALANDRRLGRHSGEGYLAVREIVDSGLPFQMRIWFLLYDTPLDRAVAELGWLKGLLYRRGRMASVLQEENVAVSYASNEALCEDVTAAVLIDIAPFVS